jgi:hypothetical protein
VPPTPPFIVRKCTVSVKDTRGVMHTTTVHTNSVLHAAAAGLKYLEETDLLDGCDLVGDAIVDVVTQSSHTIQLIQCMTASGGWANLDKRRARPCGVNSVIGVSKD